MLVEYLVTVNYCLVLNCYDFTIVAIPPSLLHDT